MSLFARHKGRHCRHGSVTGWAGLAQIRPAAVFPRRRVPLALLPVDDTDVIPFATTYRHPYDSPEGNAA